MKKLAVIGASGHGKVVADIALLNGYDEIVFLDDNNNLTSLGRYPVVGNTSKLKNLASEGYAFIVGIGNAMIRQSLQLSLENSNCNVATLIHPKANVSYDSQIGQGSVVMAKAVISSGTVIGKGCIVNTCASVGCDNTIGDFCHISVGAKIASKVSIDSLCWIGIGAVVSTSLSICSECMIGAGAVVEKDLYEAGVYVGYLGK